MSEEDEPEFQNPFELIAGMIEAYSERGGLTLAVWNFINENPTLTIPEVIDHFVDEELKRQEKKKYVKRKRRKRISNR